MEGEFEGQEIVYKAGCLKYARADGADVFLVPDGDILAVVESSDADKA